jgi:hypothetical protein
MKVFVILDTRESTGSSNLRNEAFGSLLDAQHYLEDLGKTKLSERIYKDELGYVSEINERVIKDLK